VSAYQALSQLGEPYASAVELVSYHSVSKGVSGECGLRGGYAQFTNIEPGAFAELYKLASVNLCPNTMGQVAMSCMVNPPRPGDPSWPLWEKETTAELASLGRRAVLVSGAFNSLPGMSCNPTEGAMYAFPKLDLPEAAQAAAAAAGKAPDVFYCLQLLESTGISTVPGSGFGQAAGTAHFRTTILPREEVMETFVSKFAEFQNDFMNQYAQE
jgi:glutamate--glyoxylate aminotransferase